ncbi:MAG: hypothetical protein M1833_006276 [Piccolia ochrophora]|nr:MAG: hypothetical protein M1833_006276 [Piccolia ochrophora]
MKYLLSTSLLSLLAPLATAHFEVPYPAAREANEDNQDQAPCGGGRVSETRTEWPLEGGPIHTEMGHDETTVQVLLGLGNDPTEFNITLRPKFQQEGLGTFCMADILVPADAGIEDGTNATLQVSTAAHSGGGLYNCADITFRTSAPPAPECRNGTGVRVVEGGEHEGKHDEEAKPAEDTNTAPLMHLNWCLLGVAAGALGFAVVL